MCLCVKHDVTGCAAINVKAVVAAVSGPGLGRHHS